MLGFFILLPRNTSYAARKFQLLQVRFLYGAPNYDILTAIEVYNLFPYFHNINETSSSST